MASMKRRLWIFLGTACVVTLSALAGLRLTVQASPMQQDATPTALPSAQTADELDPRLSLSDEYCLGCHGQPDQTYELQNGELLDLYIPAEEHANSVHGQMGYACVQCHRTVGEYPHAAFVAVDLRDASLRLYQACQFCHQKQYEQAQDSVHSSAFATGIREAAICTDCHSAHAVRRLNDPETNERLPDTGVWAAETCARCHSAIYEVYQESVHGSALIGEGNQDVPTCIDCHGVHNIDDPTTAQFRLSSPQMCARCHTDPQIMTKYGLSTEVLNTYVADFHGTTVVLFEKQNPDAETNKPVCFDCHGIHNIKRVDDPEKGLQVRENILARCQVCHPDASANFPDAWLSHYIPSAEKTPAVYYINLFYQFLIPTLLGGFVLLVGLDFGRLTLNRFRGRRQKIAARKEQDPGVSDQPPHDHDDIADTDEAGNE
jgi:hypothetical protein